MSAEDHRRRAALDEDEKGATQMISSSDDGNNSSGDSEEADQDGRKNDVSHAARGDSSGRMTSIPGYRDYSTVMPGPKEREEATSLGIAAALKEPTFPVKLHMILSNPEYEVRKAFHEHGLVRSWTSFSQCSLP